MNRLPRFARNDVFKSGFTLIELLIVMTIIVVLAVIMVSIFNATGVLNKARDAQRKKDLGRIKIAFEEYYNDKGCYPNSVLVTELNTKSRCRTDIFSPWLSNWPCDPNGNPYTVTTEGGEDCSNGLPNKYRVLTILENKQDSTLRPSQGTGNAVILGNGITLNPTHYGVSSSNINWNDKWISQLCVVGGTGCFWKTSDMSWNATTGCVSNQFFICARGWSDDSCQVDCCGSGCN